MSRLENVRLAAFRAVAEQMSFRKAAEELYLTQPAVSMQIKALEEDLGAQLFDRTGRRLRLTQAGALLYERARQSNELLEATGDQIAALGGRYESRLSLGASTTIAQYVLPGLLGAFCQAHPDIRPTLTSGNTEHIVEAVEKGSIALGFIEGPPRSNNVRTEPFLRDELVLIAPRAHRWARRGKISLAELAHEPLLMRERGSGTRRVIELALEHAGLSFNSLRIAMEFDATEALKSAVAAGCGACFLSQASIAADLRLNRSFRIVEVEALRLTRDFLLAMPKNPELRGIAGNFRRFLFDQAAQCPMPEEQRKPASAANSKGHRRER